MQENVGIGTIDEEIERKIIQLLTEIEELESAIARGIALAKRNGEKRVVHLTRYAKTKRARMRNGKRLAKYIEMMDVFSD